MKNGGIILVAIILLFLVMFIYSYSFEYFAKLREHRKLKKLHEKEERLNQRKTLNAKVRAEKSQKLSERSEEIRRELERLAEFKDNLLKRQNENRVV